MQKKEIVNINKQILIEKSNFISKNSTFFHNNLNTIDVLNSLKNILLNQAPLSQCPDFQDLVDEIANNKVKNVDEFNYHCSFETLFAIINMIRSNIHLSEETKTSQIEALRLYIRYIPEKSTEKLYYSLQNIIFMDIEKVDSIIKQDKQITKQRRNR